jgi:hypothetical protein
MKRGPHPPYSPDLAPPDFYLFAHVEQLPKGSEFADREALLHGIEDILRDIEKKDTGRRLSQPDGETPPMW